MQQISGTRIGFAGRVGWGVLLAAAAGCSPAAAPPTLVAPRKPHEGLTLRVYFGPDAAGKAFAAEAAGWASRSGAKIAPEADAAAADVRIIPPTRVGEFADRGDAAPLPAAFTSGDEATLRWPTVVSAYRDRLCVWAGKPVAVPLAGAACVLVYRADLFQRDAAAYRAKYGRPLVAPQTWEDVAEVAKYFHDGGKDGGKSSLPPLPADAVALLREFHLLAACYDRPALSGSAITRADNKVDPDAVRRSLSFHHEVSSGSPRLKTGGFVAAADWLAGVAKYRCPAGPDAVAALDSGAAVVAVLPLADVGRLPRTNDAVDPRFAVAPLPGTRTFTDPATGAMRKSNDKPNFVPYFGADGRVGVVRGGASDAVTAAGFELLASLASAGRAVAFQSDPGLGFGPFRTEQLAGTRDDIWQRYAFDPDKSHKLADAVRDGAAVVVANPTFAPRSPDQAELMATLAIHVRAAAEGKASPADAMAAADAAWRAADAKNPNAAALRKKSAGLD